MTELKKIDVVEGTGKEAAAGKPVLVHYTGWLYDPAMPDGRGQEFDSSAKRRVPFGFVVGAGARYAGEAAAALRRSSSDFSPSDRPWSKISCCRVLSSPVYSPLK